MEKILIVGHSFVGMAFFNFTNGLCDVISHNEIYTVDYSKYGIVINTSISPEYRNLKYLAKNDIDRIVANLALSSGCYYLMFSTRKVYGNSKELMLFSESDTTTPFDFYSENKLYTENIISKYFDNYCILRGSNFYGFEIGRKTFLGFCLDSLLKYNKITYNVNFNNIKDFINIQDVCKLLSLICKIKPKGIFNLGANRGISIENLANNIIEGYGSGEVVTSGDEFDQQFILDTSKLYSALNYVPIYIDYDKKFIELGKQLRKYNDNDCNRMV